MGTIATFDRVYKEKVPNPGDSITPARLSLGSLLSRLLVKVVSLGQAWVRRDGPCRWGRSRLKYVVHSTSMRSGVNRVGAQQELSRAMLALR